MYDYPALRVTYLYLNNSKAPMNQVDLRRAVSWATDYQGMVSGILGGNGKQMRGPIPDGMWGFDPSAMQYSLDMDKAKAALANVADKPKPCRSSTPITTRTGSPSRSPPGQICKPSASGEAGKTG